MNLRKIPHHLAAARVAAGAGIAAALLFAAIGSGGTDVQAQAPSCSATVSGAAADGNQAFVDLGVGSSATFVCISSSLFSGGKSAPITANGLAGDGCYVVEGIGTSVVAVYWQGTTATPNCPALVRIDVGTSTAATPTATATATTPAATATPTRTPTAPAATATPRPATPTVAPATPTAVAPTAAPRPPATGSGITGDGESSGLLTPIAFAVIALTGAAGASFVLAKRRTQS